MGNYNKVTACQRLLDSEGKTRGIGKEHVVFCGDSPNDEPLFAFFDFSVGVANLKTFEHHLSSLPKYLTEKANGSGFQELALHLLGS